LLGSKNYKSNVYPRHKIVLFFISAKFSLGFTGLFF